jgi:hypothetical protein
MQNEFDGETLPTAALLDEFTDEFFSGYTVSGKQYMSTVCFDTNCQAHRVYSGDYISEDNWFYNIDGAYGIIGLGPNANLWQQFTSPYTLTATYSIELARIAAKDLGATTDSSNITLGAASDENYVGQPSIQLQAESNFTYAIDYFGFGKVYYTDNEATSAYFSSLDLGHTVLFAVNFQGMGLPTTNYYQYQALLKDISNGDVVCSDTDGGLCTLN